MSLSLVLALQTAPLPRASAFDLANAPEVSEPLTLSIIGRCKARAADEIVVCDDGRERYRLPLPNERARADDRVRGEAPTGMAAITPPGRCGIFAGERRCDKREAARYGYGEGRNPITVLARLAAKISDPNSD